MINAITSALTQVDSAIISASIEALGAISAAIIAGLLAGRIVKKDIKPYFHTYSDKPNHLKKVLQEAQHDIFISASAGNNLLTRYEKEIEKRLKDGIFIRYLLLDEANFLIMEKYFHKDNPKGPDVRNEVIKKLNALQAKYPKLLEVRVFNNFMCASYIAIDLWTENPYTSKIQTLLYQYHVGAKKSPITTLFPKRDENEYTAMAESIMDMWTDATKLNGQE